MSRAPARPAAPPQAHTCAQCHATFWARPPKRGARSATVCGRPLCWAMEYWGPEEWDGRRRMAEALLGAMARGGATSYYVDPVLGPRWCLPSWSDMDEEAMRRGRANG